MIVVGFENLMTFAIQCSSNEKDYWDTIKKSNTSFNVLGLGNFIWISDEFRIQFEFKLHWGFKCFHFMFCVIMIYVIVQGVWKLSMKWPTCCILLETLTFCFDHKDLGNTPKVSNSIEQAWGASLWTLSFLTTTTLFMPSYMLKFRVLI
jgi:hypothetical protein